MEPSKGFIILHGVRNTAAFGVFESRQDAADFWAAKVKSLKDSGEMGHWDVTDFTVVEVWSVLGTDLVVTKTRFDDVAKELDDLESAIDEYLPDFEIAHVSGDTDPCTRVERLEATRYLLDSQKNKIEALEKLVEELKAKLPQEPLKMVAVQSSNVDAVGYEAASSSMHIKFKNGATYKYADVPQGVYTALLESSSVGSFLSDNVKGKFTFSRIS